MSAFMIFHPSISPCFSVTLLTFPRFLGGNHVGKQNCKENSTQNVKQTDPSLSKPWEKETNK